VSSELDVALRALTPHFGAVALCAARLVPVAFLCPALGGQGVPTTVKLGLCLSLSLFFHLAAGVAPDGSLEAGSFAAAALRELVFGAALGMIAALPFDSARTGGKLIELFRGSSAEAALPSAGTRESALGDGLTQLLVALAATGTGLPLVLRGLTHSFALVHLGQPAVGEGLALHVARLVGGAFACGLAIGAPIAGLSLAIDASLGLLARAMPQLNLQDTGAPLRILVGGAAVWLGFGVLVARLLDLLARSDGTLNSLAELAR